MPLRKGQNGLGFQTSLGWTISSTGRKLEESFGSVANNVYVCLANPQLQEKIAGFPENRWGEHFSSNGVKAYLSASLLEN